MITFYPRDIGMWRNDYDFSCRNGVGSITLVPKQKTDHKTFYDRNELIEYLKEHGVRLDDSQNPMRITGPINHEQFGPNTYSVVQWSLLGWIKDNYK